MADVLKDINFMESVWWVLGQLWDKDLVYKGFKEMHNCLTIVACHHSFTHCWHKFEFEFYCKVSNQVLAIMNLKRNLLAKKQQHNVPWKSRIVYSFCLKIIV